MPKPKYNSEVSARHEIGHALAFQALGFACDCVCIAPAIGDDVNPWVGGWTSAKSAPMLPPRNFVIASIAICVAGVAAETAHRSERFNMKRFLEQEDSQECAEWLSFVMTPSKGKGSIQQRRVEYVNRVGELVIDWMRKPAVAKVAKKMSADLLRKKKLTRGEIARATKKLPAMFLPMV